MKKKAHFKILPKSILKNAGMLFSGTFIAQMMGFLILPILSRIYSVAEFGAFTLFASIVAVGMVSSGLRYELGVVAETDKSEAQKLVHLSWILNIGFMLISYLVLFLGESFILRQFGLTMADKWIYWVPLVICITGFSEALIAWYNREKSYNKISSTKVLNSFIANGVKLVYHLVSKVGNGLILGQLIGQAASLIYLLNKKKFAPNLWTGLRATMRSNKDLALFSAPAAMINILALFMPVFLMSHFDSQDSVGHFGNARTLIYVPMGYVSISFGQVLFERISRINRFIQTTSNLSYSTLKLLFGLGIIPTLIIALWGKQIVPFILGSSWQDAGEFAQIAVPFFFVLYITNPFSSAFVIYKKLKNQFLYNTLFLIVTATTMLLIYHQGGSTKEALAGFVVAGSLMRIVILNYFFVLFGKSIIKQSLLAILIIVLTLIGGFNLTDTFPL